MDNSPLLTRDSVPTMRERQDECARLIDQRKWAVQLLASAYQSDAKGLVEAEKTVVAYVESGT